MEVREMPNKGFLSAFDRSTTFQLAVGSGLFSILVTIGLLWYGLQYRAIEHFDDESFVALKLAYKNNPNCEAMKNGVRVEDYVRIQAYFDSQRKLKTGGWLLLAGLLVYLLSMRRLASLGWKPPDPLEPEKTKDKEGPGMGSLTAVLSVSLPVVLVTLLAFTFFKPDSSDSKDDNTTAPDPGVAVAPFPEAEKIADNMKWTQFRGTAGSGRANSMELPLEWDAESGKNIIWKVPEPMAGNSSPIIWGDRIFLTGATKKERKLICLNRADGSIIWECTITTRLVLDPELEEGGDTGLASPTPVTDGRLVYVFFGTAEMAAVDFDGKQVWGRWFGPAHSMYGLSSSLILHKGKVILQLDQDEDENTGKSLSAVYSINASDGTNAWKVDRDVPGSWSTPIIANVSGREEIVTAATPWVISYNPEDGTEWWRAKVLSGDVAPVPVFAGGLFFNCTEYAQLSAIRSGGEGDITETHVAWAYDEDLPDVAAPISDDKRLLLPTGFGTIHCFEVASGSITWSHDFDDGFWSSPLLIGEIVYMTNVEGKTSIFRLADSFQLLGEGNIGESVVTTPALAEDRIYMRGKEHLYCIGIKQ
jgi:outer membrane protein assembly factor BamB